MLISLLALASGTGLVAMVGWSLLRAAEQSRERAELDARTRARELAQALRAALRSPAVLQLVDPAERFAVQLGNVVCPREVDSPGRLARPRHCVSPFAVGRDAVGLHNGGRSPSP